MLESLDFNIFSKKSRLFIFLLIFILIPTNEIISTSNFISLDTLLPDYTIDSSFFADISENCSLIGKFNDNIREPTDCEIVNQKAYLMSYAGLMIVDISNPFQPVYLDDYYYKRTNHMIIRENIAYLANHISGLHIVDISNSEKIEFLGYYQCNGYYDALAVTDDLVLVSDDTDGLVILNVSNYSNIYKMGNFSDIKINSIEIVDHYAIISRKLISELLVIDFSNPTNLINVSKIPTSSHVFEMVIQDEILYCACGTAGLELYNISDPLNISFISSISNGGEIKDLTVTNSYAYLANEVNGIEIIDLINKTNPTLVSNYFVEGFVNCICKENNKILLGKESFGFELFDITSPTSPINLAEFRHNGFSNDIATKNNYAYVLDAWDGIEVLDIENYSSPQKVSSLNIDFLTLLGNIICYEDYLYATGHFQGTQVINIKNPIDPKFEKSLDDYALNLFIEDSILYSLSNLGIYLYDLKNPASPKLIGSYENNSLISGIEDIYVKDAIAYISTLNNGLIIMDTSDPSNPTILTIIEENNYHTTNYVFGNLLFDAQYDPLSEVIGTLDIYDISDLSNPEFVASFQETVHFNDILVVDQTIFLSCSYLGVLVYDITDISNFRQIAHFCLGATPSNIHYIDTTVFLANTWGGIQIFSSPQFPTLTLTKNNSIQSIALFFPFVIIPLLILRKRHKLE